MFHIETLVEWQRGDLRLLSAQNISCGTLVWDFTPGWDKLLEPKDARQLPPSVQTHFAAHAYRVSESGLYVLMGDYALHLHYTDNEQAASLIGDATRGEYGSMLARRDLQPKDELVLYSPAGTFVRKPHFQDP